MRRSCHFYLLDVYGFVFSCFSHLIDKFCGGRIDLRLIKMSFEG